MTVLEAAELAFNRYSEARAELAQRPGTQLVLWFSNAAERAAFWRGTWLACEYELERQGARHG